MPDEQRNRAEQKRTQAAHLRRIAKLVLSRADRGILIDLASSLEVEATVLDEAVIMANKELRLRASDNQMLKL